MNDSVILNSPKIYAEIERKSSEIGFTMPSDVYAGSLLKTLISSKPNSNILELGTGIGLSLSWMIDGMDAGSKITSIDNDPKLIAIVEGYFGNDDRVDLVCMDGADWIKNNADKKFDVIFADAWPGKYGQINEILEMVTVGGFYIIDDMTAQPNWPEGHQEKVDGLIAYLEERKDFNITKMHWSTGVIIAVKNNSIN